MLSKGKKRLSFDVLQDECQEVNQPYEDSPKIKRSVKRHYIGRPYSQSGWNTVGEGFEGLPEDKQSYADTFGEENRKIGDSPVQSQESIQWEFSDEEQCQQDCYNSESSRNVQTGVEKSIQNSRLPSINSSGKRTSGLKKKTRARVKSDKNYSVRASEPVQESAIYNADSGTHSIDIDTVRSPASKRHGAAVEETYQKLKLVTSSGSEESVYVEGQQERNSVCTISQYESDSEEVSSHNPVVFLQESGSQTTCGDVEDIISSSISQQSNNSKQEDLEEISKVKASDWARSGQHNGESESTDAVGRDCQEQTSQLMLTSTGKDAVKFKESLADRIERLVEREKSYYTLWLQKATTASTKTDTDAQKILLVKVHKKEVKYSLLECHCICLSNQTVLLDSSEKQEEVKLKVLFHMELDKVIKLGSVMKIHPPWQKMSATKAGVLVLCTHYPEIIGYEAPDEYKTLREENITWVEIAKWQCPCLKDDSLDPRACPALLNPLTAHHHHKLESQEEESSEEKFLERSDTSNPVEPTESAPSSAILTSIENQGGFGIRFTALVQRVFCRVLSSNRFPRSSVTQDKLQYGFLVQDQKGTLCEIQLPESCLESAEWRVILETGEGGVYHFTKLKVVQRTNQAKHRALFSMLNLLWCGEVQCDDLNSQINDASPESFQATNSGPPSFCYILKCDTEESHCTRSSMQLDQLKHKVSIVDDLCVNQTGDQRCSFLGKVIIQWEKPTKDGSNISIIYVVSSIGLIVPVFVGGSFHQQFNQLIDSDAVLMKDALISSGRVHVDGYSKVILSTTALQQDIVTVEQINELENVQYTIPLIDVKPRMYDLVSVEGAIVGIEESTAYSWLVCETCNNDRLAGGTTTNPQFHCNRCNKTVERPATKLSLEVYLKLQKQDSGKIKVKLTQDSIQKLLPSNMAEGYDVDCVLNKHVGPLPVIITGSEKKWGHSETQLPIVCTEEVHL